MAEIGLSSTSTGLKMVQGSNHGDEQLDLSNIYSLHKMQDATNIFTITINFP